MESKERCWHLDGETKRLEVVVEANRVALRLAGEEAESQEDPAVAATAGRWSALCGS